MPLQIGVNVLEVDGPSTPTLAAAPTSVAAFVGRTRRGVPDRAVRITDAAALAARFGDPLSDAYTALAVLGFLANGGRTAFVVRVVGAGSAASIVDLPDRRSPAVPSLRVAAGRRGEADPGPWGDDLRLDVRDDPQAATTVTAGIASGATDAVLASVKGVAVGTVLRFPTAGAPTFRKVTTIDTTASRVSWTGGLGAAVAAGAAVVSAEFRLVVRLRDPATGAFPVVEDWGGLSMQPGAPGYAVDRVGHPATGSGFVTVTDLDLGVHPGVNLPAVASGLACRGGTATAPTAPDLTGSAAAGTGLHALDTSAVQLLAVPDAHTLTADGPRTVALAALDYCAARGDCTYVGAPPDRGHTRLVRSPADYTETVAHYVAAVEDYAAGLQGSNVYGALYAPWILVPDPVGSGPNPVRPMPPDGHVLGVYARTEAERGIFKAPAGDAALVRGSVAVAAALSDAEHTELVRVAHVNGVRAMAGRGIVVAASRTLSTDVRWQFVNVRLLFNMVKATLRDGLRFVRQEPHTPALRRSVTTNVVTPFLLGLWRQGAFGSDPPAAVFSVKCDEENNPPAQVDLGNFRLEVYFYAARPTETVQIVVGQQPSGATAAEA